MPETISCPDVAAYTKTIRFQSIRGDDAESSGLKQLALCISTAVGSIVAGGLVMAIGFYNPFVILGSLLVTAGSALLMTIKSDAALGIL